ncbi:MAG: hypothetical protein KDB00_26200, partial [Planctomycetales bacterium]|nr:hypothetical protein [Planctomycetales bacterium]
SWQLSDCGEGNNYLTPKSVIDLQRSAISSRISGGAYSDLRVQSRFAVEDAPAEVVYVVTGANHTAGLQQFIRPDFDLEFIDRGRVSRWSPQLLLADGNAITLHDRDDIPSIINNRPLQDDPQPVVDLRWSRPDRVLQHAKLPEMKSMGTQPVPLRDSYLWQYAVASPVPSTAADAPTWIRYQLPDVAGEDSTAKRSRSIDGPITVGTTAMLDEWRLSVEVNEPVSSQGGDSKRMQWKFADSTVEMTVYEASVTAYSPEITAYARAIQSPESLPNAQILDEGKGRTDPMSTTSLVFGTGVLPEASQPHLSCRLVTRGGSSHFDIESVNDCVTVFLPYASTASIDAISKSSANLIQRRDPVTLRTVIDRDVSHGHTEWKLKTFELLAATPPREMARVVVHDGGLVSSDRLRSVMSLLPWVENRDAIDTGNRHRILHHRNMVLEHGEFSSSSQDRTDSGTPMAIAASYRDFIEAVRDPYTIAVPDLPNREPAAEIINWLPGAALDHAPSAYQETPNINFADLSSRIPAVKSPGDEQKLMVLYRGDGQTGLPEPSSWLSYDVRWDGWVESGSGRRPRITVASADPSRRALNRFRPAQNGSVPLLHDDQSLVVSHAASFQNGAEFESWIVSGQADGQLIVSDAVSGKELQRVVVTGESYCVCQVVGAPTGRFVLALTHEGNLHAWQAASMPWTLSKIDLQLGATSIDHATMVEFEGQLAMFAVNRADGTLKGWTWDPNLPETDPVPIDGLDTFDASAVRSIDVCTYAEDAEKIAIAMAQDSGTPIVLVGDATVGGSFDPVSFDSPPSDIVAVAVSEVTARPYSLELLSVSGEGELPERLTRRQHVVVAILPTGVHVRVFDRAGEIVTDKGQHELVDGPELAALQTLLATDPFPKVSELTAEARNEVIQNARIAAEHVPGRLAVALLADRGGTIDLISVWKVSDDHGRMIKEDEFLGNLAGPKQSVERVIMAEPIEEGTHPAPAGVFNLILSVAYDDGSLESFRPLASSAASSSETKPRPPYRGYRRHDGKINSLRTTGLNFLSAGDDGRFAPRTYLITASDDGTSHLSDLDAGHEQIVTRTDSSFLDNLGTSQVSQSLGRAGHRTHVEQVSFPGCVSAVRNDPRSTHLEASKAICLTRDVDWSSPEPWLASEGDLATGDRTEVVFIADGLRIRHSDLDDRWIPEFYPDQCDPLADRPVIPFDVARGNVGSCALFSSIAGDVESLAFAPRIAGLPCVATEIDWIIFGVDGNGQTNFDAIEDMQFAAVLINPLNAATDEHPRVLAGDVKDSDELPGSVQKALSENSLVTVRLRKNATGPLILESVTSRFGKIDWTLEAAEDSSSNDSSDFPARMFRIRADVGLESFQLTQTQTSKRIVLSVLSAHSQVEWLGGLSPLLGDSIRLTGFGNRLDGGKCTFGFEGVGLQQTGPEASNPRNHPLITQHSPAQTWQPVDQLHSLAIFDSRSLVSLSSHDGHAELQYWDSKSGRLWSSYQSDADVPPSMDRKNLVAAGVVEAQMFVVGNGVQVYAFDPELETDFSIGRPTPSANPQSATFAPAVLHGASVSASAISRGDGPSRLVTGDVDGRLKIWDLATGRNLSNVTLSASPITELACGWRGTTLIIAAVDNSTPEIVLVDGDQGVILDRVDDNLLTKSVSDLDLRSIGDQWLLAATDGEKVFWWELPEGEPPRRLRDPIGNDTSIDSIALGKDEEIRAVYMHSNGKVWKVIESVSAPTEIFVSSTARGSIRFFEDARLGPSDRKHYLAIALADESGSVIGKIHQRVQSSGTWSGWTEKHVLSLEPVPPGAESETRHAVEFSSVGESISLSIGPRVSFDVPLELSSVIVQSMDVDSGELASHFIRLGSAGGGVHPAFGWVRAPHAAMVTNASEIEWVDLRLGRLRHKTSSTEQPTQVAIGRGEARNLLIYSADNFVRVVNTTTRGVDYEFDFAEEVTQLEVTEDTALVGGEKIRLWRLQDGDPLATSGAALSTIVGEDDWTIEATSLLADPESYVLATRMRKNDQSEHRVTAWRFDSPGDAADMLNQLILSEDDENAMSVVCLPRKEGLHVALEYPDDANSSSTIDVWTFPSAPTLPKLRWRLIHAGEPDARLHRLGSELAAQGNAISQWDLLGNLSLDSRGHLHHQLAIDPGTDPDVLKFNLFATLGDTRTTRLALQFSGGSRQHLFAQTSGGGRFGMIGDLLIPNEEFGAIAVSLHRNDSG